MLLRVASGSKPIVSISCIVGLGAGRCHVSTHADVTVSAIWKCRFSYRRGRAADRSRKLFSTASMSSPGRSPIPATINARAAISRNSWPSNTTRRLSSPASNGRPRDRRPRSAVPGADAGAMPEENGPCALPCPGAAFSTPMWSSRCATPAPRGQCPGQIDGVTGRYRPWLRRRPSLRVMALKNGVRLGRLQASFEDDHEHYAGIDAA